MSDLERLTITLPTDMASIVKGAVTGGDYASTSEVIRAALRDWKLKRSLQHEALASLRADVQLGLDDIAAGRVVDFDVDSIIRRGRERLAAKNSLSD